MINQLNKRDKETEQMKHVMRVRAKRDKRCLVVSSPEAVKEQFKL